MLLYMLPSSFQSDSRHVTDLVEAITQEAKEWFERQFIGTHRPMLQCYCWEIHGSGGFVTIFYVRYLKRNGTFHISYDALGDRKYGIYEIANPAFPENLFQDLEVFVCTSVNNEIAIRARLSKSMP